MLAPHLTRKRILSKCKPVCVKLLADYIALLLLEERTDLFDSIMQNLNGTREERKGYFTHLFNFLSLDIYKSGHFLVSFLSALID